MTCKGKLTSKELQLGLPSMGVSVCDIRKERVQNGVTTYYDN